MTTLALIPSYGILLDTALHAGACLKSHFASVLAELGDTVCVLAADVGSWEVADDTKSEICYHLACRDLSHSSHHSCCLYESRGWVEVEDRYKPSLYSRIPLEKPSKILIAILNSSVTESDDSKKQRRWQDVAQ